jgi:hypothetical protein
MGTRTIATTNKALAHCLEVLETLIEWAEADAEHAFENDAPETAKDDLRRHHVLRIARVLVASCQKED